MKEVEEFVRQYFVDNNIPLEFPQYKQSTVILAIYGYKIAGCGNTTAYRFKKKYFPNLPNRVKISNYILNLSDKKLCNTCNKIFNKKDCNNYNYICKDCDSKNSCKWAKDNPAKANYNAKMYKLRKINRTPFWANLEKIKEIYLNCPKGYHVDHIIPLLGILISGLHIETNLQYISARDNLRKSNKYPFNDYLDPVIKPEV